MKKQSLSDPAMFMYSVIALTAIAAAVCFGLYYTGLCESDAVLLTGIISFMILYHFGMRILVGVLTKVIPIDYNHGWFREKRFEGPLYRLLRVRKWKDKVLTFDPASFDFRNRTLHELATTMAKSELDHWINEILSAISIFFTFIWGCFPAFFITAVAAMLVDAQFILVQRYNRPIVLRLMERRAQKEAAAKQTAQI